MTHTMKTISKAIAISLIVMGIVAIALGWIITPEVAKVYFSSDGHISPIGLETLGIYRTRSLIAGYFLILLGILFSPIVVTQRMLEHPKIAIRNEKFVVGFLFLVGSIFRLISIAYVGVNSPFIMGGLFAEFSQQLVNNNYSLPAQIPYYSDGGIPFAYPPLPFYIKAILINIFSIPKFTVVNVLPAFITLLTLPSFYILIRVIKFEYWTRMAIFAAFAIYPNAFREQIEGKGLAEAFGTLSIIWFMISLLFERTIAMVSNHISCLEYPGQSVSLPPPEVRLVQR